LSAAPLPPLPARDPSGHKGSFGTVLVVGGQCAGAVMMLGGPALSALGAVRAGAGRVMLAMPAPILPAALTVIPAATGLALPVDARGEIVPAASAAILDEHAGGASVMVIGPGLGTSEAAKQVVIRAVAKDTMPIVVDADALNALAMTRDFARDVRTPLILTPHAGEYRRLAGALGLGDLDPVAPPRRREAAERLAQRLGAVVVLKGPHTLITDGARTIENESGGPALAIRGSGDVLAGVIGGLIAQFGAGADPPLALMECAAHAVRAHGASADAWAKRHGHAGMTPEEIAQGIPACLRSAAGAS